MFFSFIENTTVQKENPEPDLPPSSDRPPLPDEHDPMGSGMPGFPKPWVNPDELPSPESSVALLAILAVTIMCICSMHTRARRAVRT